VEDSPKYRGLRQQLVALLQQKGIKDVAVLEAMGIVPRHWFMDKGLTAFAYEDKAYPIAADQTISQPYTVAFQTQLLELQPGSNCGAFTTRCNGVYRRTAANPV
jgi:protein-L-isoaspartate(D-aspartate) O-methyltransferase